MGFKKQTSGILIVALSLATAWAIRGQFGHEQGAAWAGAIGGLAVVLVSKRKDWYDKMILVALAAAIGWGAGGMISYGMVVGYGRADNFINAFYGLGMLFVIGSLFGLLGGGMVGMVLDSTPQKKVHWGALLSEMVAGALISYFFLIEQIGFKMTPPRSEAWALILGAGLAMLWHMARENRNSPIRAAVFSAFGGGIGFAFGNFLQIIGTTMEVPFNMWNVMEYSVGFFGGCGMAYGIFSSIWPIDETKTKKWANWMALFVLLVFIPLIVYRESLTYEHLVQRLGDLPSVESVALTSTIFAAVLLILMAAILIWKLHLQRYERKEVALLLVVYLSTYGILSYVVTGIFAGHMVLNHHLYIVNIILIFLLLEKGKWVSFESASRKINSKKWIIYLMLTTITIALLALFAVKFHDGLPGGQNRFLIH
ncbi:hypothetical protein ACNR9Q_11280 [Maribacter sp. X9]|uniref:hypothetical protein n=1 Tax=Maribacter sp. X9 TaxID=3402159 RepID=UPI003AF362F5